VREWWQQLEQREQVYLLAAGIAVSLYVLYMVLWLPVVDMRNNMSETNQRVAVTLARVQDMSAQLQQAQSSGNTQRDRNLSRLINTSTAKHKITPSRIQASSSGSSQIRFEEVDFAGLLRWLHQIEEQEDLVIFDASISQGARGGLVDASIRVGSGN
jgi:general secretion pathway protein M